MKITDLIEELNETLRETGDLNVFVWTETDSGPILIEPNLLIDPGEKETILVIEN